MESVDIQRNDVIEKQFKTTQLSLSTAEIMEGLFFGEVNEQIGIFNPNVPDTGQVVISIHGDLYIVKDKAPPGNSIPLEDGSALKRLVSLDQESNAD